MELPPYLKLGQNDESEHQSRAQTTQNSTLDLSVTNPLHSPPRAAPVNSPQIRDSFVLRVLNKESKVEIRSLNPTSSILDLKSEIAKQTEIPVNYQRLIFSGKHLNPDTKLLSDFNITTESSIHLFPRLNNTSASNGNQGDVAGRAFSSSQAPRILRVTRATYSPTQTGMFGEYNSINGETSANREIFNSVPEVRLWCYILFFYSFMTLFSHVSFIADTGTLGHSVLDGTVTALETIFSVCGVYVSHMGLKATQTVNRDDVKKYVLFLCSLTVCVVLTRILWIINMIIQAKIGIRKEIAKEAEEAEEEAEEGNGKEEPDDGLTDDYYGGTQNLNPSTILFYFSIQVIIMALIYSTTWVFCVSRALRFRHAVEEVATSQTQAVTVV